jgi:peptidoglycan hydrolase CwlO-like protein
VLEATGVEDCFVFEIEQGRQTSALMLQHIVGARRSFEATQARIGRLLRQLYVEGEADPIEVVLGARSLDAVLEGVDALQRATRRNRALAVQARSHARALAEQLGRL